MFRQVLVLAGSAIILASQPVAAAPSTPLAPSNPPPATTWWYSNYPSPFSIVGVRRQGNGIQFVDNWMPCFTGQGNGQDLWIGVSHAAVIPSGRSTSLPFLNVAPARTSATR